MLSRKPNEFEAVHPQRIDRVENVQTSLLKCRERRRFEADWLEAPRKTLRQVIDDKSSFNYRSYSFTPRGVLSNLLFARRSGPIAFQSRLAISVGLKKLVAVLAPTSLPSHLESIDSLVAYNP